MRDIKSLSTVILIILIPFTVFYAYSGLSWSYTKSYVDLDRWVSRGWTDSVAEITSGMQIVNFILWSLPVIAGLIGFFIAMRVLADLWRGRVFETSVASGLRWIGVSVFLSSAFHMLAASLTPMIQSWNNSGGVEPLRFWYQHAYIGLLFCGFGFWVMGQVMTLAIKAVRENEEFI